VGLVPRAAGEPQRRKAARRALDLGDLGWQILDIWARELPIVGYLGEFPKPFIVKNGLHNFVSGYPNEDLMKDESVLGSQTLYWDEPEKHV